MAALRFLLAAGLCSLASANSDDSSLFQRGVGMHVHGPEGGPDEPPSMAIQRIEATTRDQLLTDMGALLEDFVHLATAVEAPMQVLLSEPVHDYEHWTAESMSVFTAGYVLAFRDAKFEPLVNKTMREVSSACSKLGAKMETIAAGLGKNTKTTDRLAMKVVQISVQQASEVMIAGMGEVFDSMSEFLAEPLTTFLKASTKEMAFYVKHHTSNALAKFNRNALQPFIKKAFEEEGDICEHVSVKVADFGKMSRSIKDNAVEAAAKLTQEVPAFGLHLSEIDIKLVPHVVSTTNKWLEDFGSSIAAMGKGFKAYHEAIAEAGKAKLRCTLKK